MTEPALFDVDPWREATLADCKPGDWVWQLGFAGKWAQIKTITAHPNGRVDYTLVRPRGTDSYCMGGYVTDYPVRIHNGVPDQERVA